MSQHVEWSIGLQDWTVNPGEWVDGYGSRNTAVAIWSGHGDGVIIEFASKEAAVKELREFADAIENAEDTSRYDECRWCGARIVFVPEYNAGPNTQWVHVGEIGAETPTTCDGGDGGLDVPGEPDIGPTHRFIDDEPTCRACGVERDEQDGICIPTEDEEAGA